MTRVREMSGRVRHRCCNNAMAGRLQRGAARAVSPRRRRLIRLKSVREKASLLACSLLLCCSLPRQKATAHRAETATTTTLYTPAGCMRPTQRRMESRVPHPPPSPGTRHGPKVWVVAPPGACGRSAPPGFCRALVPALPRETRRHGTQGLPLNEVLAGILCCSLAGASDGATSEAKPPTSPVHVRPDHRSIGRVGSCKKSLARVEEERRRRRCWARLPSFGPP